MKIRRCLLQAPQVLANEEPKLPQRQSTHVAHLYGPLNPALRWVRWVCQFTSFEIGKRGKSGRSMKQGSA